MSRRAAQRQSTGLTFLTPAMGVLVCATVLSVLGAIVLLSASLPLDDGAPYRFIEKQISWIGITLVVGLAILKLDLEWARKFIWLGYGACLAGLGLVLVDGIGTEVNGSKSWIRFGVIGVQVAEFAKIGLVFALAHYFSLIRSDTRTFWKGFIAPCLFIGMVVGLILLQTDLGTALIISLASLCILFLAGSRIVFLLPSALLGILGAIAFVRYDVERWSRLTAFLDMEGQKSGDAYQIWQAIIAFGAGGVNGVGLGNGRQQLRFLPEAHNDFIFAVVGEELGLIATLVIVVVFSILFVAGFMHLRFAPNTYQYLLAAGCLLTISIQAIVNLGVVTGLLPTTGLPLPFISYGGSNFLVMGICVAILINTSLAWGRPALKDSKRKLRELS